MIMSNSILVMKTFTSKLRGVVASDKNMTENVQLLCGFVFEQAASENCNLTPMRDLLKAAKLLTATKGKQIEAYLMDHVENARYSVDKNGNMKVICKKGTDITVHARKDEWNNYKKDGKGSEISPLAKLSESSLDKKLSAYKDRVSVTTSGVALTTQRALLKAQLAALEFQIKTFTEVEVEVEVEVEAA